MTFYACKSTNDLKVKFDFCSFQGEKLQYKIYAFFEKNNQLKGKFSLALTQHNLTQVETKTFEKQIITKKTITTTC